MKAQTQKAKSNKVTIKQQVKATNNIQEVAKQVKIAIEQKPKAEPKQSAYYINVISKNAALKTQCKSLGGARAILLNFAPEIGLSTKAVEYLKSTKSPEMYATFLEEVRTSKSGNYSPFFILQSLYRYNHI